MHKVESSSDLWGNRGTLRGVKALCGGSRMERKYLKLSGNYQGEGTHALPEIGNEKQSHSAGGIPKWKYLRSLGKSEMEHLQLFGEAEEKYLRLARDAAKKNIHGSLGI